VPARNYTDLLREISNTVATLTERLDHVRRDIDRLDLALKKEVEEKDRRRWNLQTIVISAVLSAVLTLIINIVIPLLRK
jgi:hypothetical protein